MNPYKTTRIFKLATIIATLLAGGVRADGQPVENFCFLQISDVHVSPQPVGTPDPPLTDRSVETLAWFCAEADKPQILAPLELTTSKPSFTIATGDLTEYGVIGKTWGNFTRYLAPLDMPLYVTPGNHDNTWTAMLHVMRQRYGSDHYSFDAHGCHFICIDTATPQEPVPSIDERTITFLRRDLRDVHPDTPVFLFCHHPLSSGEFASINEKIRLLEAIRAYNVVLLLMGHGHGVRHERWGTLDSVMGGSTFGANTGYSVIVVRDNRLRIVYRFKDESKPMQVVLEKPLTRRGAPKLVRLEAEGFAPSVVRGRDVVVRGVLAPPDGGRLPGPSAEPWLFASLNTDAEHRIALTCRPTGERGERVAFDGRMSTEGVVAGRHFVQINARIDGVLFDWAPEVRIQDDDADVPLSEWRRVGSAGAKAKPLVLADSVILAGTHGLIERVQFDQKRAAPPPLFDFGVEIINAPAPADDRLYVSAAEKGVWCVRLDRENAWQCDVGAVVYGTPTVTDDTVYVGDLEGGVHAIDRESGKLRWSKRHATFSIEQSLLLHAGVLYFGAWDGFIYAAHAADGALKWKVRCPAGQAGGKFRSRYYGAADCPPIIIGDRMFVTDRAYRLGSYDLDGKYLGEIAQEVAAIGLSEAGTGFYARGLHQGLTKYDGQGNVVWTNNVALGRFPIPPTEKHDRVYACSNRGLLTVCDAADGKTLWQYQVTPQLPVMAPVAVDDRGRAYVAGMDGTLTRVGPR